MAEFEFGNVTKADKAPHPFAPMITQLIERTKADSTSVIWYTSENEDDAKVTLRQLQTAAKEQDVSAVKRAWQTDDADGKGTVKVAVGVKLERIRRHKREEAATEELPAEAVAEATPAAKPTRGKK